MEKIPYGPSYEDEQCPLPDYTSPAAENGTDPEKLSSDDSFSGLISRLTDLKKDADDRWRNICTRLGSLDPAALESARNLVHYLSLRRHDIRGVQNQLARNGFSSLGRAESHVMSNLTKVLKLLARAENRCYEPPDDAEISLDLDEAADILIRRTEALLGKRPPHRKVRIMVTLPSEAAEDYELVRDLILGGMDCARINCAHDTPEIWQRIVDNVRNAGKETGRDCNICIDVAGPKLRTGAFRPGPQLLKLRPERDALGRPVSAARVLLTGSEDSLTLSGSASTIALPTSFLRWLHVGDKIKLKDARGSSRSLHVVDVTPDGIWAEARKTTYLVPDTVFKIHRTGVTAKADALSFPAVEQYAELHIGDALILTRSQSPGRPARVDAHGQTLEPARIPCTLPEVFESVKAGEKIWFDDGKLGGVIALVDPNEICVEIVHAGPKGHRLKRDKGINLPESQLALPSLTAADREDLKFIVKNADLVGYSFVHTAADVNALQKYLGEIGGEHLGIVLKIETRSAFENLPEILLAAMETAAIGVMIARGDLAVELGFERMAEVQEEILWMCEAAHVPVIWATQVLEQLTKKGIFARAEITDAAMSERAECVMLNKGPYVLEAVRTLDDILRRMQSHQEKKRAMMRPLKLASRFFETAETNLATTRSGSNAEAATDRRLQSFDHSL